MATLTIERSRDSAACDSSPMPCVDDLDKYLPTHQPDGPWSLLKPGEYLVTSKFLDQRVTAGKEYEVRAIGQQRYARFTGRLTKMRPSYGWVLTFEDPKYIASDGSLVSVEKKGLGIVFPREQDFTIYADSTPLGYGLLEAQPGLAIEEPGGSEDARSIDSIHSLAGCYRRQLAHRPGASAIKEPEDTTILTEQSNGS